MKCIKCGAKLRPGARFCAKCGAPQPAPPPAAAPPERPQVRPVPPPAVAPPQPAVPKPRRGWLWVALLVGALFVLLCVGGGALFLGPLLDNLRGGRPGVGPAVTERIGPEGGEIIGPGEAKVIVPEGALHRNQRDDGNNICARRCLEEAHRRG
jgi:hypothetical protein